MMVPTWVICWDPSLRNQKSFETSLGEVRVNHQFIIYGWRQYELHPQFFVITWVLKVADDYFFIIAILPAASNGAAFARPS